MGQGPVGFFGVGLLGQPMARTLARAGIASPVLDVRHALFAETVAFGHGAADMIAVLRAMEAGTRRRGGGTI